MGISWWFEGPSLIYLRYLPIYMSEEPSNNLPE
jgi:hypothetical protein